MSQILDRYLDRVLTYADRPEPEAACIRAELKDHLCQQIDDFAASGLSREDAVMEALQRHGNPRKIGYGLRPHFPLIDIRSAGTARGVIAIGPRAVGVFAFGGVAVGVVACGGAAVGLVSAGGFAAALFLAWGGLALGGVALGGLALGAVAFGGLAVGLVAEGGLAVGLWVPMAGNAHSYFTASDVPGWLRALQRLMVLSRTISDHFNWIVPFYVAFILAFQSLRVREARRVSRSDDWLIGG